MISVVRRMLPKRYPMAGNGWWLPWLLWTVGISHAARGAADTSWIPDERLDQPWQVQSFLDDSGLRGVSLLNIAFQSQPTTPGRWTAWIATARGLREFDGYHWRRHGREQGLPSEFVRGVLVTRAGSLWVATDQGAGVYDGRSFRTFGSERGLAGQNVRRIYEDSDGTLWFTSDTWPTMQGTGGLSSYRDGKWRAYGTSDGLPSDYTVDFHRDRSGRAWVSTLGGVAWQSGDRWVPATPTVDGRELQWGSGCFAETDTSGLLLSTGKEVFFWRDGAWRYTDETLETQHGVCATTDGQLVAVAHPSPNHGAFAVWGTSNWVVRSTPFVLNAGAIIDIREAPDGALWAIGEDCLARWTRRNAEWSEFADLPPPQMAEPGGRVWFSAPRAWSHGQPPTIRFDGERWEMLNPGYQGLSLSRSDGTVWGWQSNSVTRWSGHEERVFDAAATGLVSVDLGRADGVGRFWALGRDASGMPTVAGYSQGTWERRSIPEWRGHSFWRTAAGSGDAGVWFASRRGPGKGAEIIRWIADGFDKIDVPEDLLGTFWTSLAADSSGGLWLIGDRGLYRKAPEPSATWKEVTQLPRGVVVDGIETGDAIWMVCRSTLVGTNGLVRIQGDLWSAYSAKTFGDVVGDRDHVVAGGDGEFHVVANRTNAWPTSVQLPVRDVAERTLRDATGAFWVYVGLSVYRYRPDPRPPDTLVEGPEAVAAGGALVASAEMVEPFLPRQRRPDQRFAWRLDGAPWSQPVAGFTREIPARGLKIGRHRLEVKAVKHENNEDPTPALLIFDVRPRPIQEQPWFIPVIGATMACLVTLATVAVQARRRLAVHARNLEWTVAERTAELRADVERRTRAEQAAREGAERFSKAFRANPVIAAITTHPEARCLEINRALTESLGYEAQDLVGRSPLEVGLWVRPEQRDAIVKAITRGETVRGVECELRAKNGATRTVLTSVELIEFSGQRALLFVALDITDRKKLEAQLRQAQKMEAIGLLSGGIAHDFNNILGAILGNVQMALLDLPPGHPAAASLDQIQLSADRAAGLVRQILAFARQDSHRRTPVDLRTVVAESVRLLRATIPSGVDINLAFPESPCCAAADVTQIHQVVLNLGTNAWHALEGRPGRIDIELTTVAIDADFAAQRTDLRPGPYQRLRVADSGKGMDAATLERIFDPFFTTKDVGQGTGLGLSVVHGILQSYGGAIVVRSLPGQGAIFDLYFPACDAPTPPPAAAPAPPPAPAARADGLLRGKGESILLVDDEESIVKATTTALRRFGYRVTCATDAAESLERFRTDPQAFDLVISDYNMPGLSGVDLAQEMRRLRPDLPIILTSGFLSDEIHQAIARAGIQAVLRKPSSLEELSRTVHGVLHPAPGR